MTMPSSPSNTTLPSHSGLRMGSPAARKELGAFSRYSGSAGTGSWSFSPSAWKLFHSAMTLLGWVGVSSLSSSSAKTLPVGSGAANMSPRCSRTCLPSSVPKPVLPPRSKRTHRCCVCCMCFSIEWKVVGDDQRGEQLPDVRGIARDVDAAVLHHGQLRFRRAQSARNDGARMAHALARRRAGACDEADHGLAH